MLFTKRAFIINYNICKKKTTAAFKKRITLDGSFGCDYNVFYTRRLCYPLPIFKRNIINMRLAASSVYSPILNLPWTGTGKNDVIIKHQCYIYIERERHTHTQG